MPATGLKAGLGLLLLALVAVAADQTPFSTLGRLAGYLSDNDADNAVELFDPAMKGFAEIERNIEALSAQAEVTCSIDVLTDEEAGGIHKLDVDWYLQLKSQSDGGLLERRRERVQIEMREIKGQWKIVVMSPLKILAPIQVK